MAKKQTKYTEAEEKAFRELAEKEGITYHAAIARLKPAKEATKEKKKRLLTISETKLGVTMVLDHDDLKQLGYKGNEFTGIVIDDVRKKLNLSSRSDRKEARKEK